MSAPLVTPPVCPPAEPTVNIPGPVGPQGIQGVQGIQGIQGTAGATVLNGASDPHIGQGSTGDYYLNTSTADLFQKGAVNWAFLCNLSGPPGASGAIQYNGSGVPAVGLGNNGDYYIRTTTGDLYYKSAGAWTIIFNLTGPTGAAGTSSVIRQGAGAPGAGLGNDSDLYIRTSNGDLYYKALGAWSVISNVIGPAGAAGAAGADGVNVTFAHKQTSSSYGPCAVRALSNATMVVAEGTAIGGISGLSITPKAASHYIRIDVFVNCRIQKTGHVGGVLVGLFLNGTAAAIASTVYDPAGESEDLYCPITLTHFHTTTGTAALTFDVRVAATEAAADVTINDKAEIPYSSITAVEYVP